MSVTEKIIILDFGAQTTQLIARRIRELGVFSEIWMPDTSIEQIIKAAPKGIVLSGGPASVYANGATHPDTEIFNLDIPILGICYGLQLIAHMQDGEVNHAASREYGRMQLQIVKYKDIFNG